MKKFNCVFTRVGELLGLIKSKSKIVVRFFEKK